MRVVTGDAIDVRRRISADLLAWVRKAAAATAAVAVAVAVAVELVPSLREMPAEYRNVAV